VPSHVREDQAVECESGCSSQSFRTDAHRAKRMHAFVYGRVGVDGIGDDDDREWIAHRGQMGLMLSVEYLVRSAWLNCRVEMLRRRGQML
jgi:hypothetical protein